MRRLQGMALDEAGEEPLYRQLAEEIAARIRRGVLPVGYRLPSTRGLAEELEVHRNTVVRAFEELTSLGLVHTVVGRGTFVSAAEELPLLPVHETLYEQALPWDTLVSQTTEAEPFGRLRRLSPGRRSQGLINLARMEPAPELFPVERFRLCINHVLRTQKGRALGYAPREGVLPLRQQIVEELGAKGIPAGVEDVVITTGSQQGLDLVARGLLEGGDSFFLQAASYTGAICIVSACGARSIGVPGDPEGPSVHFLERSHPSRVKGFYLMPNVCNPTGICISEHRRRALLDWSHRQGIPLIEDDYAADLELDRITPPPALRALDREVIYIGTFSKKLIPALRLGFLLCPPAFHRRLLPLKHAMDLGTSVLLQHTLAEFMDRGYLRAHLRQSLEAYRQRRDALEQALYDHLPDEVTWNHALRGPLIWLSLPPTISAEAAYEVAAQQGVLVTPSTLHQAGSQQTIGGLRLVFTYESPERLAEGGRRLGEALQQMLRHAQEHKHHEPPTLLDGV